MSASTQEYAPYAHLSDGWIDYPGFALERDMTKQEYELRVARARSQMAAAELDALVITSSAVGRWFTSRQEPHEWHDQCPARSTWYILTHSDDYLYMPPTTAGEHFNTTRRTTWVTNIRAIVERATWPRVENWAIEQMPDMFDELGLGRGRLGFELGDCMTLGISVNDFRRLGDLLPHAHLADASPVVRYLMSHHTPTEIDQARQGCTAGIWIHNQVPAVLRPGMTERAFLSELAARFAAHYGAGYSYQPAGAWDVRNPTAGDSNLFHHAITERTFKAGDLVARGTSGASYHSYGGDVDRLWYIGDPPQVVRHCYRTVWECNRAMADMIKPGQRCSDIYAACARVEEKNGFPKRVTGRVGHGLRNTGGLSVHPDNHTVLEPEMIISVEPMLANEYGWFDLEDQYVVTERGAEILHDPAPEDLPIVSG